MTLLTLNLFPGDGSGCMKSNPSKDSVLLYYSKKPTLPKYPKFDLWIFADGRILYKEIFRTTNDGEISSVLPKEDIYDLIRLLECCTLHPSNLKTSRDLPVTTLKFNGREFEYHISVIDGPLKTLDDKMGQLLGELRITGSLPG